MNRGSIDSVPSGPDSGRFPADQGFDNLPPSSTKPRFLDRPVVRRASTALERRLLQWFLSACGNPEIQVVLWDGRALACSRELPVGNILIHDPVTLRRLLADTEIAFGDAFTDGTLEIQGPLVEVLMEICRALRNAPMGGLFGRILNVARRWRSHSVAAS